MQVGDQTTEDIFNVMRVKSSLLNIDRIDYYLHEALKYEFVSKSDQTFILVLSSEIVAEMIAEQVRNKVIYAANINANIIFLENYLKEKS